MSTDPAVRSCEIVRRYLTAALFDGGEHALAQTVSDPALVEQAWLFWAAFPERSIDEIDVLFASADGTQVGCHLTATATREGPWVTPTIGEKGVPASLDCTATYVIAGGRISSFHEAWR